MKLTILTENTAGGKFLAEHGLSYIVEHDGQKILFDTGHSNVFLKNAEKLGVDIQNDINTVVLSHGHWDHGDGLRFIENKTLITHPGAFIKRFRKRDHTNIGLALDQTEIETKFKLISTKKPFPITGHIFFLGEIPRKNDFEAQTTAFIDKQGNDDYVWDDSAMVVISGNELVIISGCAHSGICNIVDYAISVTGIEKIKAVIGGFHLKNDDHQTKETIKYLKSMNVSKIFPSHCTELPALSAFYKEFKNKQLKTGMILHF